MINSRYQIDPWTGVACLLVSLWAHSAGAQTTSQSELPSAPDAEPETPADDAGTSAAPSDGPALEATDAVNAESTHRVWPAKSVLLPIEAANLEEGERQAFETLFIQALEERVGGRVMTPAEAERAMEVLGSAQAVLAAASADSYVQGSIVRLDAHLVISMSTLDATGKRLKRHKMTAGSVDDFEAVAERLAEALTSDSSVKDTRDLDNITTRETKKRKRVFADDRVGFRGGLIVPVATAPFSSVVSGAVEIRYESEDYYAGWGIGMLLPAPGRSDESSYGGLSAEVNAAYYLSSGAIAPYLGGNLTARILSTGANLAPGAILGINFNRDVGASMLLELRLNQNVTPIRVTDDGSDTTFAYPFEPSLNAGVLW